MPRDFPASRCKPSTALPWSAATWTEAAWRTTASPLLLRRQALEDQDRLDARALLERVASSLAEADVELGEGRTAWDLSLDTLPYPVPESAWPTMPTGRRN